MMHPRAILATVLATGLLAFAALPQARATAEHTYGKREYGIIGHGRAPNGRLSIAAHGEGEGAHDKFHVYLMAEPAHRKLAVLDNISEDNNLDTAPDAYSAEWSPDSRYVTVRFRSDRHIMTLNFYAIADGRAKLLETPDLFRDVTGRSIDYKSDGDMRTSVPVVDWLGPRRFRFTDYRLFVMQDAKLADELGALAKQEKMDDGRYTIEFSAQADGEVLPGNRLRVAKPQPGKFEEP
jgi:hypothetical protein